MKCLHDMANRTRPIASLLGQGVKIAFAPATEAIVRELLAELSTPPVFIYSNWDGVTDYSRPFLLYCDVSVDSFGTPPSPSCSSAALPSSLSVAGPRSTWKRAALSGVSSAFEVTCGVPISIFFEPQGDRKPRQDCRTQPASTEVAIIPDSVQVHLLMRQMQCQRERRFFLPPAFAYDGARPQWFQQPYSVRRRTRHPHPLARPTSWRTLHRGVSLGGLAPSDPTSGLGGFLLSPDDFKDFPQHGPRMRVDDLDTPSGELVARAPLDVASPGANWVFPLNACTSDLDLHAVSSDFPTSLHNDSAPLPTPVATPASSSHL